MQAFEKITTFRNMDSQKPWEGAETTYLRRMVRVGNWASACETDSDPLRPSDYGRNLTTVCW